MTEKILRKGSCQICGLQYITILPIIRDKELFAVGNELKCPDCHNIIKMEIKE